jgi:hypothetical protein
LKWRSPSSSNILNPSQHPGNEPASKTWAQNDASTTPAMGARGLCLAGSTRDICRQPATKLHVCISIGTARGDMWMRVDARRAERQHERSEDDAAQRQALRRFACLGSALSMTAGGIGMTVCSKKECSHGSRKSECNVTLH